MPKKPLNPVKIENLEQYDYYDSGLNPKSGTPNILAIGGELNANTKKILYQRI